jgi:DNA-binding transcriptional ArsR family regulator
MIRIHLGATGLANVRFVYGPVQELWYSLALLRGDERRVERWADATRAATRGLDLRLVEALRESGRYVPDCLMPGYPRLTTPLPQLAALPTTAGPRLGGDLAFAYPDGVPSDVATLVTRPREALESLSRTLADYWHAALAPTWRQVQAIVESDLLHWARELALHGPGALLGGLHPSLRYTDGVLAADSAFDVDIDARARPLWLVPTVYGGDSCHLIANPDLDPGISYPARGAGRLWLEDAADGVDVLDEEEARGTQFGEGRARVLAALRDGATTSTLAVRLGVTASAVSQHLGPLGASGLIRSTRVGRYVHHTLTDEGRAVLETFDALRARARPADPAPPWRGLHAAMTVSVVAGPLRFPS